MASINWSTTALRDLDSLDNSIVERVIQKVQWLGENLDFIMREPLHHDLKRAYKLRVGNYRVFYILRDNVIHVEAVRHRSEAYR